ncbi:MAG: hypothetical protein K2O00_04375 [Muribaculaceae bacterium]|nr:hypothetical protein [Muribaculaceae bacterium]
MAQIDLESLRHSWQNMRIEIDRLSEQNRQMTKRIVNNQAKSVKDSLLRKYRMLCIIGIIYIPIMPYLCERLLHTDLFVTIIMSLFFPCAVVINGLVYFRTRRIDPSAMSMKDMLIAFTNLKILRSRMRITSYILALPVLACLLYYMYGVDESMFIGGCAGGVIGAIIGVRLDLRMSREIRELRRTLAEELEC